MTKAKAFAFVLASALLSMPVASQAAPTSSEVYTINAYVPAFCRISAPDREVSLTDGAAVLGTIHEICNTPSGYTVETHFSNLSGGNLEVAAQQYAIDQTGLSLRRVDGAHDQNLSWQIANAQEVQPGAPVTMQVTISPI